MGLSGFAWETEIDWTETETETETESGRLVAKTRQEPGQAGQSGQSGSCLGVKDHGPSHKYRQP